ncbi:LacI family DNA-binding transcriptional regulator [Cohnella zeiphila]|uniref:LacI family DNA-binding transcriptional regulator n=1 Tax=Cohnella zeiphila TaxID=2761120 RepID=A0A7X0SMJ2_9BACL|nr:LacI family DNA-binding transcriptional regulator [Cohnella zeiphila]MBB6731460.1 LacI family DNA-binding transcriptional regulator [Cohnella zeiphila]
MGKGKVTIKDVAKVAGVSTGTVSYALAGDPRINEKTRKLVEEAAHKLNYIPNEVGRSLRSRKTETIAFVIPNTSSHVFSHPYFLKLLEGITEVLEEYSYNLQISTTPSEKEEAKAYDKILRSNRVDGIILSSASLKDRNILRMVESGFPVVYLGKWHHEEVLTVERDDFRGAYEAASHLAGLGRRRIVHISGPLDHQESVDRLEGYKQALSDHQILYDASLVVEKDFSREAGAAAVEELRAANVRYDGIFAGNDLMAIGALKQLKRMNIAVPEEVSVVGFDDIDMADAVTPELTTVHQPMREIGRMAAEKLLAVLQDREVPEKRSIVSTRLIIRESCGGQPQ